MISLFVLNYCLGMQEQQNPIKGQQLIIDILWVITKKKKSEQAKIQSNIQSKIHFLFYIIKCVIRMHFVVVFQNKRFEIQNLYFRLHIP